MTVVVNLFGSGIRCWISEIPIHRFNQLKTVAEFNKMSLNTVFFDLDILGRLGYCHWKNIYPIKEINGFIISDSNRIEIKEGRKLMSKFMSRDILRGDLLFDIYNTKAIEVEIKPKKKYKYILIGQKETGSYKYQIEINDFEIDKLCFSCCKDINKENTIVTLSYDNVVLKPIKEDTIVRSFFINYLTFKK